MRWRRQNPRLPGHDYAGPGVYFLTCCTRSRRRLLTDEIGGRLVTNRLGQILERCWKELPSHYLHVKLDEFVVMPDHFHGIIILKHRACNPRHDLFEVVRALKSFSARGINEITTLSGESLWQRGYYHVVINDRTALNSIREYIRTNRRRLEEFEQNLAMDWLRIRA